jgi:cystathionine gamma-lyase
MKDSTRTIWAGQSELKQGQPFMAGPVFAGPFKAAGEPASSPFTYGRFHNPTWTNFEKALSELEQAHTVVFASGMAAVASVFGTVLSPGDILVMPSDAYYTTRVLASGFFEKIGIQLRLAPTAGDALKDQLDGARLLWIESPSNPGLDVCDIAELANAAHAQGTLVAVDNTTATILGQEPIRLGADFSVASDTKALTGHSDVVLGHVAVRDTAWLDRIRAWRTQMGAIPGPMEVWLAHRSLSTLALRMERQCLNALAIARFLTNHINVIDVRYPGLDSDPAYPVAKKQMKRFGPVVSFSLPDRNTAEKFLASCRVVIEATSFGGIHSTAERRARWGGDKIPEGFIRFSAGCEDTEDLVADVKQALNKSNARGDRK